VPEPAEVAPTGAEPVLVGHRASPSRSTVEVGTVAGDPTTALPGIDPAVARGAGAPPTGPPAATGSTKRTHRAAPTNPTTQPTDVPANGTGNGTVGRSVTASDIPAAKPAARSKRAAAASPPAPTVSEDSATAPVDAVGRMVGASLTLDELCAASGITADYVGQLQEYGLVRAAFVGGAEYFDEEALAVANVAAKLAAYGIEARHLRLYKNAADREAGFIEQVVIPMVRQRNPEARARASQTADELAALGQQLRASLLRTALQELLQG
jgi:hypothetical protein